MPTFDLPQVRRLKLGLPGLHPPHHLLVNNSMPLLGPRRARERLVIGEKQKRPVEDLVPKSPHAVEPIGFIAASQVAARAKESCHCR